MRLILLLVLVCMVVPGMLAQEKQVEVTLSGDAPVIPMPVIDRKKVENESVLLSNGMLYQSEDKGSSWNEEQIQAPAGIERSWIFSNKKGDLYRIDRADGNTLQTSISNDHGMTWKALGDIDLAGMEGLPALYFDPEKDRMAVTYVRNQDCKIDLIFVQSSNSKKFDDPQSLIASPMDCNDVLPTNPDVIIDPRDFLFAVWAQGEKIYMDRSYNDGKTWLRSDIMIQKRQGSTGRPVLAVDRSESVLKGAIYLLWADSVAGGQLLKCARSTNNGDIWSAASNVHGNAANIHPLRMMLDQSNGFLYVLYYVPAGENTFDLMLAYSDDGAQSFTPVQLNAEPVGINPEMINYPVANLDVYKGKILLTWSSFDTDKQQLTIRSLTFEELKAAGDQLSD